MNVVGNGALCRQSAIIQFSNLEKNWRSGVNFVQICILGDSNLDQGEAYS